MTAARNSAVDYSDSRDVDDVIRLLRNIMRETGLARTLAIGRLVLEHFFSGSIEAWQDHRRNKNNSIRRLAERPDCPLSRSVLNQAIGVFVALRGLPSASALSHIGASHIAAVLSEPEPEREHWLVRANSELWSVRRLTDEIRYARRLAGERRGRPRKAIVEKALTRARAGVEALGQTIAELEAFELGVEHTGRLRGLAERLAALEGRVIGLCRGTSRESLVLAKGPASEMRWIGESARAEATAATSQAGGAE